MHSRTAAPHSHGPARAPSAGSTTGGRPPQQRVLVVGGGFGGLYAAIRLTSLFWPRGKRPQVRVWPLALRTSERERSNPRWFF